MRSIDRDSNIKKHIASTAALPDSTEVVIVGAGKLTSPFSSQTEVRNAMTGGYGQACTQ